MPAVSVSKSCFSSNNFQHISRIVPSVVKRTDNWVHSMMDDCILSDHYHNTGAFCGIFDVFAV